MWKNSNADPYLRYIGKNLCCLILYCLSYYYSSYCITLLISSYNKYILSELKYEFAYRRKLQNYWNLKVNQMLKYFNRFLAVQYCTKIIMISWDNIQCYSSLVHQFFQITKKETTGLVSLNRIHIAYILRRAHIFKIA